MTLDNLPPGERVLVDSNIRIFASTSRVIIHKKNVSVLVERDEDGYLVATVPTLPGCHTQARSMDDLLERVKEAIEAYLEMQIIR
jgi:predicted RNase H-like HicB family nuclease